MGKMGKAKFGVFGEGSMTLEMNRFVLAVFFWIVLVKIGNGAKRLGRIKGYFGTRGLHR